MHANQIPFNQCRYQSRASPSPPPIPPQPNHIQYKQPFHSIDIPPPPPRCYQLVPIRDTTNQISAQSPKLYSFGNITPFGRKNNYENIRDIVKPPFAVKDPRRKPYYYNELNQSIDAELTAKNAQLNSINKSEPVRTSPNDEIIKNSVNKSQIATDYGSGGSLDHIF